MTPLRRSERWSGRLQANADCRTTPACQSGSSCRGDRKSTRLNSSHLVISYAVFCLKKIRHLRYGDTPAPCVGGAGVYQQFDILSEFFFNDTATTEIYTLSLHDALPI